MTTVPELVAAYERKKAEAEAIGATAPVASVYGQVLKDLRAVDGVAALEPKVNTTVAGQIEGVDRSTIAKRCQEGWYPGAEKTSDSQGGEWRIPLSALREPRRPANGGRGPQTPSLIR